jgi:ATP-dependent exoDNAse (exonuclease V) beta subunit
MSIVFNAADHSYKSIDNAEDINWISVTSLVSSLKEPFDAKGIAAKITKSKRSKWYGVPPEKILELWQAESDRAIALGTFYHNQRESDICSLSSIEKEGVPIPVYTPIQENNVKTAPPQRLTDGIYPEHMVYLKSAGICGQSDLVEVVNGRVHIIDYKTNKEIKTESFKDWEGISKKMLHPVNNLDDCNFNHYSLQLSIYMYIILKHNPKLKPGDIYIHHIVFEEEGKDEYGYPITKYSIEGDPIVKEVIPLKVPYLKDEVISIINWLHDNRDKITKK